MSLCGLRYIDLNNDTLKILCTLFSYNEKWKEKKKVYKTATNIQRVLKTRNLKIEVKIVIFKTIANSKVFF